MNVSFQNRIAFYYMIATAVIMAIVFTTVYTIVRGTVYANLDRDLTFEAEKHAEEIKVTGSTLRFVNKAEWQEIEHREIHINPVFIQLIDKKGRVMDKSPNLKDNMLPFNQDKSAGHFDNLLDGRPIRQAQLPIEQDGQIKGYILSAISSESAQSVLLKLRNVLIISYLLVLVGLYFISRFLAGQSIIPIKQMTRTMNQITKNNLNERVKLPENYDELHELSLGFNALLQRIEDALKRERQFTSDASHELRTPLATLRGTLEVLIRKPRNQAEYEEKIKLSLTEIDRMTATIEQLLLLARLDTNAEISELKTITMAALLDESIERFREKISRKNLRVSVAITAGEKAQIPHYYAKLIVDNVLSNALKYSHDGGAVTINVTSTAAGLTCTIKDEGIGIKKEDLDKLYDNFYRSDALNHNAVKGNGLGLSIAKKASEAIKARLSIESALDKGTTITIIF